jgi:hypothetical protein
MQILTRKETSNIASLKRFAVDSPVSLRMTTVLFVFTRTLC